MWEPIPKKNKKQILPGRKQKVFLRHFSSGRKLTFILAPGPGHLRARILGPRNRTLFTEVPAALFHRANLLLNMRSVKCEAPELQCFPYRLPSSAKQRGRPVSLRFDVLPDFPSPSPRMLPSPDGESDEALKEPPRHLLSAETASFLSRTANGGKKFLLPKQHDR